MKWAVVSAMLGWAVDMVDFSLDKYYSCSDGIYYPPKSCWGCYPKVFYADSVLLSHHSGWTP